VCGLCDVTQDDVESPRDPVKLDLPPVLTLCVCGLCGVTQDDVELPRDPVKLDLPPVLTLCVVCVV